MIPRKDQTQRITWSVTWSVNCNQFKYRLITTSTTGWRTDPIWANLRSTQDKPGFDHPAAPLFLNGVHWPPSSWLQSSPVLIQRTDCVSKHFITFNFHATISSRSNVQLPQPQSASEQPQTSAATFNFISQNHLKAMVSATSAIISTCYQESESPSDIARRQEQIWTGSDVNQWCQNKASEITHYPGLMRTWTSLTSWILGIFR